MREREREREGGVSSNASIHVLTISDVSNSSISSDSPSWFKRVERARRVPLEVVNGLQWRVVLPFDSRNCSPLCRFFFSARVNRRTCAASSPPRAISMQRRRVSSRRFERSEGRRKEEEDDDNDDDDDEHDWCCGLNRWIRIQRGMPGLFEDLSR